MSAVDFNLFDVMYFQEGFGGGTYFVQEAATKNIKIGKATNFRKRLLNLSSANSCTLKLLAIHPDLEFEKKVQAQFRQDRIHGEWFNPTSKLLAFIDNVATHLRARCECGEWLDCEDDPNVHCIPESWEFFCGGCCPGCRAKGEPDTQTCYVENCDCKRCVRVRKQYGLDVGEQAKVAA